MRSRHEVTEALRLLGLGVTPSEVSARLGVPRSTVRAWQVSGPPGGRKASARELEPPCPICGEGRLKPASYTYLLGLYLGDGCISANSRSYRLRIFMDAAYPRIVWECALAIEAMTPWKRAHVMLRKRQGGVEVGMYWDHWPCLFPQHGPGKKHDRTIALVDWQKRLVGRAPQHLVKGLIESDGCRVVADDRGVASLRYHFKNRSADIRRIYCDALDLLDIPWTTPSTEDVAVYRKGATARLDEFVGPKS